MRVDDIMSRGVFTLPPTAVVAEALDLFMSRKILHLLVVDNGRIVGTVSVRELSGKPQELTLTNIMNCDFRTAPPSTTLKDAARMMIGRSAGCIPIVDAGRIVGIVTSTDLMKAVSHNAAALAHDTV